MAPDSLVLYFLSELQRSISEARGEAMEGVNLWRILAIFVEI